MFEGGATLDHVVGNNIWLHCTGEDCNLTWLLNKIPLKVTMDFVYHDSLILTCYACFPLSNVKHHKTVPVKA